MKEYAADIDRCDCTSIHEDVVNEVKAQMPEEELMMNLADIYKVFSDSTRVKILFALSKAQMCVCDIAVLLGMTKSAISHQLRLLKQANIVKYKKIGRVVYYSLADSHVKDMFEIGMIHAMESENTMD